MPDLVAIDVRCWRRLGLREDLIRHYARAAHQRSGDVLVFNAGLSFISDQPDLFSGCTTPVPTEAAVQAVERSKPKPPEPVPYAEWPAWAKLVAKRRKDGETGVGETFERLATAVGGKVFERAMKKLGANCGCAARKARWQIQYPYHLL